MQSRNQKEKDEEVKHTKSFATLNQDLSETLSNMFFPWMYLCGGFIYKGGDTRWQLRCKLHLVD